jgi:hypothetical protein
MAPRSIGLKLCNRNFFYESHNTPLISREVFFKSDTLLYDVKVWDEVSFLPISAENGGDAVKSLTWKAYVDPTKYPNHPGVLNGKPRHGVLDSKCIEFINTDTFRISLPKDSAHAPGILASDLETQDKCPIEVKIRYEPAAEGLGLAGRDAQTGENLVVYNPDFPESSIDVLLHELGHSMGQTVYSGHYLPPKGLKVPKRSSEVDEKYSFNGKLGHIYVGKKHSGSHCAYGLTDAQKKSDNYSGLAGPCIMYGENDGNGPSTATEGFCPQCLDYIKSRDLRDLSGILE